MRRRPIHDIARLVLRHTYGTVSAVSSAALTVTKDFPVYPATNPETEITSTISLTVNADGSSGTIVYDLDAGTRTVVDNFSAESGLANRYVRIAARYQEDGTLTAVRVWVSSDFSKVWLSPEGHVLNVNTTTDVITVTNEDGIPVPVTVDAATQFFFRTPQNALADATPIGTGTGFLDQPGPGARLQGARERGGSAWRCRWWRRPSTSRRPTSAATSPTPRPRGSPIARTTWRRTTTTRCTLDYIASTTANGENDQDIQITGFDWWYFTFPTLVNYGTDAPGRVRRRGRRRGQLRRHGRHAGGVRREPCALGRRREQHQQLVPARCGAHADADAARHREHWRTRPTTSP